MVTEELLGDPVRQVRVGDALVLEGHADLPFDLLQVGAALRAVVLRELLQGDPPERQVDRLEALLPQTLPTPWDELMLQPAYMQALDLLP